MELKPSKTEQQKKKLLYGATGGVLVASIIGGSILGAYADKEPDNVTDLDPVDSSSQETKVESNTVKKDAASISKESSQEKTTESQITESQTRSDSKSATASEASESSNDKVFEQPSAPTISKDEPVYESPSSNNASSYDSYSSYEEPASPSSSHTNPTYEEPPASAPSYSSNNSIEYTKEDINRTNKAVSDWNTQNGFGGDNSDAKGNGYLGW